MKREGEGGAAMDYDDITFLLNLAEDIKVYAKVDADRLFTLANKEAAAIDSSETSLAIREKGGTA